MAPARKAQHILKLSVEQQNDFVNSFKVVMCDCDGVVWKMISPIPKSGEAVNVLKANGKEVLFVTNNSLRTDEGYAENFATIGVKNFQKDHIIHPAKSVLHYLKKHNIRQPIFSMGSSAFNETVRSGGVELLTLESSNITLPAFPEVTKPKGKVGAVLYDINLNLTYAQLCMGIRYLMDKDCILIAAGTDWLLPFTDDLTLPGFCDFLETIKKFTHREAVDVAKPSYLLGDIVKEIYNIKEPQRCLFIGDSMRSDIPFGKRSGFQTLLVLSGSTPLEVMLAAEAEQQPDYYADGMADFIKLYENIEKA